MTSRTSLIMLGAASMLVLSSCGGGTSGDSTPGGGWGGGGAAINYTGSMSEASLSYTNTEELTASAYQGGTTGASIGSTRSQTDGQAQRGRSQHLALSSTLRKAVQKVDFRQAVQNSKALISDTMIIAGDCAESPGSATMSLTVNDATGAFYGTVDYNNFCTQGNTLDGSTDIAGLISLTTLDLTQFSTSFDALTSTSSCGDSTTASGAISVSILGAAATEIVDMLVKDNLTTEVFWIDDFTSVTADYVGYADTVITGGRFYHPAHGYISASTTTPIRVYTGDDWPSQGVVVYTGSPGYFSFDTQARLTVLNTSQYRIEADTDGDGLFEYNSGVLVWDGVCSY